MGVEALKYILSFCCWKNSLQINRSVFLLSDQDLADCFKIKNSDSIIYKPLSRQVQNDLKFHTFRVFAAMSTIFTESSDKHIFSNLTICISSSSETPELVWELASSEKLSVFLRKVFSGKSKTTWCGSQMPT